MNNVVIGEGNIFLLIESVSGFVEDVFFFFLFGNEVVDVVSWVKFLVLEYGMGSKFFEGLMWWFCVCRFW